MKYTMTRLESKTLKKLHIHKRRIGAHNLSEAIEHLLEFFKENKKSLGEIAAELHAKRKGW